MPPKGEKRRQQIIETAKNMFITKGFQSTHIGQVCDELDIARGTVYQYFNNKKEILYGILDNVVEAVEEALDPDDLKEFLNMRPDHNTMIRFIDDRISSCLGIISDEPIIIRLIFRDIPGIDEDVSEKVAEFLDKIITIISQEIEVLCKSNIFKENVEPEIAAAMLVGGVIMMVFHYSNKNKNYRDKNITNAMSMLYLLGVYNNG
ncbi:MAG: TetR/AcrR family transcriptional regulator [Spirochaetes bacterium]|nr:TetR/AcrR family transcriptional regulator [Spirochaetota bacterium]